MQLPEYASWSKEKRHQAKIQGIFRYGDYPKLDEVFDYILPLCPELLREVLRPYSGDTIQEKLNEMFQDFLKYKKMIKSYPFNAETMSEEYSKLFISLANEKNKIIENRKQQNLINIFEKYIYLNSRRVKKYINSRR